MIARLIGILLIAVPVGLGIWYFFYWISKKERNDLISERKKEKRNV